MMPEGGRGSVDRAAALLHDAGQLVARVVRAASETAIHRIPVRHRIRVGTTNLAERSSVEERRRTKDAGPLPHEKAAMKLVSATCSAPPKAGAGSRLANSNATNCDCCAELGLEPPPTTDNQKATTTGAGVSPHDHPGHPLTGTSGLDQRDAYDHFSASRSPLKQAPAAA